MISKGKLISLLSLCLISTLACGFSTFVFASSNTGDTDEIKVGVGEVTTNYSSLIQFVNADTFTMTKSGFLKNGQYKNKENEIISYQYCSNSFSLTSIWKINPLNITSFSYSLKAIRLYAAQFDLYNFFSDKNDPSFDVSLFSDESLTRKIEGGSSSGLTFGEKEFSCDVSLPSFSQSLFVKLVYEGNVNTSDFANFKSVVYEKCVSMRADEQEDKNQLGFSFAFNKKGA